MDPVAGTLITYLRWTLAVVRIFLTMLLIYGPVIFAQGRAPATAAPPFADVTLAPNTTLVIVRDPRGADQMIVSTFFRQTVPGIEKPILRSITSVVPVVKDTAVGAEGAPDPKSVETVHVSLVKITDRQEWKNPPNNTGKP